MGQIDHSPGTFAFLNKKSLKPEGQMLRGVVYRLIESLASMGHSSRWKLICSISACNILTVDVHLSSTPSISGPGSATEVSNMHRRYLVGLACITKHQTLRSMPMVWARGQNLVHIQKLGYLC